MPIGEDTKSEEAKSEKAKSEEASSDDAAMRKAMMRGAMVYSAMARFLMVYDDDSKCNTKCNIECVIWLRNWLCNSMHLQLPPPAKTCYWICIAADYQVSVLFYNRRLIFIVPKKSWSRRPL